MGGFFGAVSHQDVTLDIFFGVDYHSTWAPGGAA